MAIGMLLLNAFGTTTNVIMSDCWHSFRVAAWQDLNGDGLWGVDELPLKGVKFDLQGPIMEVDSSLLSKADGFLEISVYHSGGCFRETYTITAEPPDSYKPTTPLSVTFTLNSNESVFEAQFGFRPVSNK
jgi:hypothetical protein